jgi:CobQ/CobB/MinD/ParA family nucleotide binding protein
MLEGAASVEHPPHDREALALLCGRPREASSQRVTPNALGIEAGPLCGSMHDQGDARVPQRCWAAVPVPVDWAKQGVSGKTTTAQNLAVAASEAGQTVALIDLDSQPTSANWGDGRAASSPAVVSAQVARLKAVLDAAAKRGSTLAILDTPPRARRSNARSRQGR